eukprot:m.260048 g.260048  ORF g.260048 m.260048 type:complete len:1505 (+) comp16212_c0_seq24:1476-5990(+)
MVHTLSAAARATLFTTVTSASAFAANTLSEIGALADFGLLTALVIASNYVILVILVPVALVAWARFIHPVERSILTMILGVFYVLFLVLSAPFRQFFSQEGRRRSSFSMASAISRGTTHRNPNFLPPKKASAISLRSDASNDIPMATLRSDASNDIPMAPLDSSIGLKNGPPDFDSTDGTVPSKRRESDIGLSPVATPRASQVQNDADYHIDLEDGSVAMGGLLRSKSKRKFARRRSSELVQKPTVTQRLLGLIANISVDRRKPVLGFYFFFLFLCLWQASMLKGADKPPSFMKEDSNLGKVQALESVFPGFGNGGSSSEDTAAMPDLSSETLQQDLELEILQEFDQDDDDAEIPLPKTTSTTRTTRTVTQTTVTTKTITRTTITTMPLCSDVEEGFCSTNGDKKHLIDEADTTFCLNRNCSKLECCEDNPTCQDKITETPTFCTASTKINQNDLATIDCPEGTCTQSECCREWSCDDEITGNPTFCSTAGKKERNSLESRFCTEQPCSLNECCRDMTCSIADDEASLPTCNANRHIPADLESKSCATVTCSEAECCEDNPVCLDAKNDSPTFCSAVGMHMTGALESNICAASSCVVGECCLQNPNCSSHSCGASKHLKDSPASITCSTQTCDDNDCCNDNPTCQAYASGNSLCSLGKTLIDAAGSTQCAGEDCIEAECCEDLTCQTAFDADAGFCGATKTDNLGSTLCPGVSVCTEAQCCTNKVNPTCGEWVSDFPSFCGAGKILNPAQSSTACAANPCVSGDNCCMTVPNEVCSDAIIRLPGLCSGKTHLVDSPGSVTCSSTECSKSECCEDNPTCEFTFSSVDPALCTNAGRLAEDNPSSIKCNSDTCTTNECCRVATCNPDFLSSCPLGQHKKDNQGSIQCASTTCVNLDCCETNPTCQDAISGDPSFCGSEFDNKDGDLNAIPCAGGVCIISECCDPTPTQAPTVTTTTVLPESLEILMDATCPDTIEEQEALRDQIIAQIVSDSGDPPTLSPEDISIEMCDLAARRQRRSQIRNIRQTSGFVIEIIISPNVNQSIANQTKELYANSELTVGNISSILETTSTTGTTVTSTVTTRTTTITSEPGNRSYVESSPNVDIRIIFGMQTPFVDRGDASVSSFFEEEDKYVPVFDTTFNTFNENYTFVDYVKIAQWSSRNTVVRPDIFQQALELCRVVSNRTDLVMPGQSYRCVFSDPGTGEDYLPVSIGEKYGNCEFETQAIVGLMVLEFKSTVTSQDASTDVKALYDKWQKFMVEQRELRPALGSFQVDSDNFEKAINELLAIDGAIWGILTSLMLCFIAVVLFKAHALLTTITMSVIFMNVAFVVSCFYWAGWRLGGIEAVSLSILVGTCVDYCIHMLEGYLEADPFLAEDDLVGETERETREKIRAWRMKHAMTSVGVPVFSSAITTAGSATFLVFCKLQMFSRFGEIIVINTCVSIILTMTLLPALLSSFGTLDYSGSLLRSFLGLLFLGALFGTFTLILYLMAQGGTRVEGADGEYVF